MKKNLGAYIEQKSYRKVGTLIIALVCLLETGCASTLLDETALQTALREGDIEEATELLEEPQNLEHKAKYIHRTALHYATDHPGTFEIASTLLNKGANVHARDVAGNTPLILACARGRRDLVELFLRHGAQIVEKTNNGQDCLYIASHYGNAEVVQFSLDKGLNPNSRTLFDWTPLHSAAQRGHDGVVRILVESGSDLDSKNNSDQTPFDVAALNEHWDASKIFLDLGIKPKKMDAGDASVRNWITATNYSMAARYEEEIGAKKDAIQYLQTAAAHFNLAAVDLNEFANEKSYELGKIAGKEAAGRFLGALLGAPGPVFGRSSYVEKRDLKLARSQALKRAEKARFMVGYCEDGAKKLSEE